MNQHNKKRVFLAAALFTNSLGVLAAPGDVTLINKNASGIPGDSWSFIGSTVVNHFSADGRFVVFGSLANLTGNDTGLDPDIFVFDRQNETVELVSRAGAGGAHGNGSS